MTDLFHDLSSPDGLSKDPVERARALSRGEKPRRFYTTVGVEEAEGLFRVTLDGKPIRTPAKRAFAVPDERLAAALAAEWQAQGAQIETGSMPLTRIVNSAIDGVADEAEAVADEAARYAGSDLLFYRADGPDRLVARQTATWDPILRWAEERLSPRFRLAEGVMPVEQDPAAIAAVRAAVPMEPLALAGFHTVTTLTGSVLIALAVAEGRLSPDEGWSAAHLDEDWNIELWGEDDEAAARRAYRRAEYDAAVLLLGP